MEQCNYTTHLYHKKELKQIKLIKPITSIITIFFSTFIKVVSSIDSKHYITSHLGYTNFYGQDLFYSVH